MASTKLNAAVLAGLLTVSLAACGSNDTATGTTPATSSAAAAAPTTTAPASPKVLAELPDLSKGESTTVTLADEFLKGLTDLKVTPGVVGKTKLADRRGAGRPVQAAVPEAEERASLTRYPARR